MAISAAVGIATLYTLESLRYIARVRRWLPGYERDQRRAHGLCSGCGYDLTGNTSGACPECGAKVEMGFEGASPASPPLVEETRPAWVWIAVVTAMVISALLLYLH